MPPTATTAWGRAVDAQLADGDWHAVEDVISGAMLVVPPGVAFRAGESNRKRLAPGTRTKGGTETSVAAGARSVARKTLTERVRRGTVERQGDQVRRARR